MKYIKFDWNKLICICAFIWSISYTCLVEVDLLENIVGLNGSILYKCIWWIIKFIFLIKIFSNGYATPHDMAKSLCCIIIGEITAYTAGGFLIALFWFLAVMKDIPQKDFVKNILIAQLIACSLIIVCSILGLVDNLIVLRDDEIRMAFGFSHPNVLAAKVLQIFLMMYYIHEKVTLKFIFACSLVSVVVYAVSDSRTVMWLSGLLIIMAMVYYLEQCFGITRKIVEIVIAKLNIIVFIISIIIGFVAIKNYKLLIRILKIDYKSTIYSRFSQIYLYFKNYRIKLLGQKLAYHGSNMKVNSELYTLDNAYMHLLLGYGLLVFILFVFFMINLSRILFKQKDYKTLEILLIYFILGVFETSLIRSSMNFSLFLVSTVLWNENNESKLRRKIFVGGL